MFKVTRLTDYAVVILAELAQRGEAGASVAQIAGCSALQEPTIAKVLRHLTQNGLVESKRGVQGGYRLARAPAEISFADVVTVMEGPIAITACVEGSEESCGHEHRCGMANPWKRVNAAIRQALASVTLADLGPHRAVDFLSPAPASASQQVLEQGTPR